MIIKSMSRKSNSFAQLFDYINGEDDVPYFVSWNLNLGNHRDRNNALSQFYDNARCLRSFKGGNVLYHEIISFKYISGVPLEKQMKALHDLTLKYIQARGKGLLSYGRMHMKQGHLHFHVMMSSNEMMQSKRHSLSKEEYRQIQVQCERYLQQTYPDLQQPVIYDQDRKQKSLRTNQREYELVKRTGEKSKRQQVHDLLSGLLKQVSGQELEQMLREHGFELYKRGDSYAVIYDGRKYRLSTLKLEEAFSLAKTRQQKPRQKSTPSEDDLENYYRQVERETTHQKQETMNKKNTEPKAKQPEVNYEEIIERELRTRTDKLEAKLKEQGYTVQREGNVLIVEKYGMSKRYQFSKGKVERQFLEGGTDLLFEKSDKMVWGYEKNINEKFDQEKAKIDAERSKKIDSLKKRGMEKESTEPEMG